jgi:hypothetical protein
MYKDDALTRHTREAARQMMLLVMEQPQGARSSVVQSALNAIKPGLHAKVDRIAARIAAEGVSTLMAYEEAIRLALADVFMDSINALARAKATGRTDDAALEAQRLFYGDLHVSALGEVGGGLSGELGTVARDAGNFGVNLLRAAACSDDVKNLIVERTTSEGARSATTAGLSVARGVSACGRLPGATPPAPSASPPAPSYTPTPEPKDNTTTYLIAGGAVLGLGAILFFAFKK